MPAPYRAGLVDALGTMVRLLAALGADRSGRDRGARGGARSQSAFRAEMAYYGAHAEQGRDAAIAGRPAIRLRGAALRRTRPADRRRDDDGRDRVRGLSRRRAGPAQLARRRPADRCVSNWDYELGDVLERIGLAGELDGIVTSAAAGARKPDPAIFELGLRIAGCQAAEAFHVGDGDEDVEGARAAGIDVIRIDRGGGERRQRILARRDRGPRAPMARMT